MIHYEKILSRGRIYDLDFYTIQWLLYGDCIGGGHSESKVRASRDPLQGEDGEDEETWMDVRCIY